MVVKRTQRRKTYRKKRVNTKRNKVRRKQRTYKKLKGGAHLPLDPGVSSNIARTARARALTESSRGKSGSSGSQGRRSSGNSGKSSRNSSRSKHPASGLEPELEPELEPSSVPKKKKKKKKKKKTHGATCCSSRPASVAVRSEPEILATPETFREFFLGLLHDIQKYINDYDNEYESSDYLTIYDCTVDDLVDAWDEREEDNLRTATLWVCGSPDFHKYFNPKTPEVRESDYTGSKIETVKWNFPSTKSRAEDRATYPGLFDGWDDNVKGKVLLTKKKGYHTRILRILQDKFLSKCERLRRRAWLNGLPESWNVAERKSKLTRVAEGATSCCGGSPC